MGRFNGPLRQNLENKPDKSRNDLWTLEAAKEKKAIGSQIVFHKPERTVAFSDTAGVLSYEVILANATVIDEFSYAPSTYAHIKEQPLFQKFYQLDMRPVGYVEGTTLKMVHEKTMPCQICGIVTPITRIEIDHMRPQASGEKEAVLKVLRMLSLTAAEPTGPKSQSLRRGLSEAEARFGPEMGLAAFQLFGQPAPVPTRLNRAPSGPPISTKEARHSLNWQGMLFYSAVKALNCVAELEECCMHSLVNLRPLCGLCNGSRGNPLKLP